jgi:hypothetical protein
VRPGPAALPGCALPAMVVIVAPGADRVHSHRSQPEVTPEREPIPSHFAPAFPVISLIPRPHRPSPLTCTERPPARLIHTQAS